MKLILDYSLLFLFGIYLFFYDLLTFFFYIYFLTGLQYLIIDIEKCNNYDKFSELLHFYIKRVLFWPFLMLSK